MLSSAPFSVCGEHGRVDGDEQEGRHGRRHTYGNPSPDPHFSVFVGMPRTLLAVAATKARLPVVSLF